MIKRKEEPSKKPQIEKAQPRWAEKQKVRRRLDLRVQLGLIEQGQDSPVIIQLYPCYNSS